MESVTSAKTVKLVAAAIAPWAEPDAILVDPCCGLGLMAKAAKKHKMRFFGNELNAARMARTQTVL